MQTAGIVDRNYHILELDATDPENNLKDGQNLEINLTFTQALKNVKSIIFQSLVTTNTHIRVSQPGSFDIVLLMSLETVRFHTLTLVEADALVKLASQNGLRLEAFVGSGEERFFFPQHEVRISIPVKNYHRKGLIKQFNQSRLNLKTTLPSHASFLDKFIIEAIDDKLTITLKVGCEQRFLITLPQFDVAQRANYYSWFPAHMDDNKLSFTRSTNPHSFRIVLEPQDTIGNQMMGLGSTKIVRTNVEGKSDGLLQFAGRFEGRFQAPDEMNLLYNNTLHLVSDDLFNSEAQTLIMSRNQSNIIHKIPITVKTDELFEYENTFLANKIVYNRAIEIPKLRIRVLDEFFVPLKYRLGDKLYMKFLVEFV
jgi:hypothetical protein